MKLVKPTPEQLVRAQERAEVIATRGTELRDLYWRTIEYDATEDRMELERLWPEMAGQWRAQGLDRPKVSDEVAVIVPITDRIRKPEDANAVRKVALRRIWRRMTGTAGKEE
jgi:hypothetical protein